MGGGGGRSPPAKDPASAGRVSAFYTLCAKRKVCSLLFKSARLASRKLTRNMASSSCDKRFCFASVKFANCVLSIVPSSPSSPHAHALRPQLPHHPPPPPAQPAKKPRPMAHPSRLASNPHRTPHRRNLRHTPPHNINNPTPPPPRHPRHRQQHHPQRRTPRRRTRRYNRQPRNNKRKTTAHHARSTLRILRRHRPDPLPHNPNNRTRLPV